MVVPVTQHNAGTPGQQFIVRPDTQFDPRQCLAHAGWFVIADAIGCQYRAALGHTVALYNIQAKTDKGAGYCCRQGGTPADSQLYATAQFRLDLAGDQTIQQGPQEQNRATAAALVRLKPLPADKNRQFEQHAMQY